MALAGMTPWLQLAGKDDFQLHYNNRTTSVVQELPDPSYQKPSLHFFLGRERKDAAVRDIFTMNRQDGRPRNGSVSLHLDRTTSAMEFPLLFADGDPLAAVPRRIDPLIGHESQSIPFTLPRHHPVLPLLLLYGRVLFTFCDTITIFADDYGGIDPVLRMISDWVIMGNSSSLPAPVRPRILIVASDASDTAPTYDVLEIEALRHGLHQLDPQSRTNAFSSILLLSLSPARFSSGAQHQRIRSVLGEEMDKIRALRAQYRALFSATHLSSFFHHALASIARDGARIFDFVKTSRCWNPVGQDYSQHLSEFLTLGLSNFISHPSLATYLASSMLMDAYPPKMHRFNPLLVFRTMYRPSCLAALERGGHPAHLREQQCRQIECKFAAFFDDLEATDESSSNAHAENIKMQVSPWAALRSHTTCLYCLRRKPEHVLTCEHAICDICVKIFGESAEGNDHCFQLTRCILCISRGSLRACVKPPTAGPRILSIDGGGVRGVVPLEFLSLLQDMLDPALRVQDLFDQAFGTSSGGLIVIGLFLKDWDIYHCTRMFDDFSRSFFGVHLTKGQRFMTRMRDYFRCWLRDGRYDVAVLEDCFKNIFGLDFRMFDVIPQHTSGRKVAVIATTISDASAYVFSNYNGCGWRGKESGYKHVRPVHVEDEPFIWEAARVTTAAPVLFRPAKLTNLGTFQDGGLAHNNPIDIALWESRKIWGSDTTPDLVLSLGTGTEDEVKSPTAPHFRHVFNDGFIPRLCRSFMAGLDGERVWTELKNRLDENVRSDYFRFNIPLRAIEPSLDNVDQTGELKQCVRLQSSGEHDRKETAGAVLATTFYFELARTPVNEAGQYRCEGTVRCRNNASATINSLRKIHGSHLTFSTDNEMLVTVKEADICKRCRGYSARVKFHVRYLEDSASIYLNFSPNKKRKIGGFPHPIRWFIQQQGLDADFGWPDHGQPSLYACATCRYHCARSMRPRRRLASYGGGPPSKRVRFC